MRGCRLFVPVVTPESADSEWCERELTLASELNKPMAPPTVRGQIPWMWNTRQVDDVTDGRLPNEDWFGKIAAGLRAGRRKQRSDAEARNYVLTIRAEWIRAPVDPRRLHATTNRECS